MRTRPLRTRAERCSSLRGAKWNEPKARALLSVHKLEEQQRLLNVQREREAHEGFMREYEAHFVEVKEEAAHREAWRIADQEAKLVTRRELAHTKAMEASWSKNTLPQLATGGSAR